MADKPVKSRKWRGCSVAGCNRPHNARGFCSLHYGRSLKYGDPLGKAPPRQRRPRPKCAVSGCKSPASARSLCGAHYARWLQHGDPKADVPIRDVHAGRRFLEEVARKHEADECLLWPFATDIDGYGMITLKGRHHHAHRVVCEIANGPPPSPKHHAAHNCGNPQCVAKRHQRWATPKENEADKILHGTKRRGERMHNARLTVDQVREIRALKGKPHKDLATRFGVSQSAIGALFRRKTWAWLPDGPTPP